MRREEMEIEVFSLICSLAMSSCLVFDLVLPRRQFTSVPTERDEEIISALKPELHVSVPSPLIPHPPRADSCLVAPKCLLP